jgi:hypothetical protein
MVAAGRYVRDLEAREGIDLRPTAEMANMLGRRKAEGGREERMGRGRVAVRKARDLAKARKGEVDLFSLSLLVNVKRD